MLCRRSRRSSEKLYAHRTVNSFFNRFSIPRRRHPNKSLTRWFVKRDFGGPVPRARGRKYVTVLVRLYLQISGPQQPGYTGRISYQGTRYYHNANSITRNYYFELETARWYKPLRGRDAIVNLYTARMHTGAYIHYTYHTYATGTTTSLGKLRRIYELRECRRNEIFLLFITVDNYYYY